MALDAIALGIVPCDCGRLSTKVHCPYCGTYDIRGRALKTKRPNPSTLQLEEYQVYRCRICFKLFDELDWTTNCNAPPFKSPTARRFEEIKKLSIKESGEPFPSYNEMMKAAQKTKEKFDKEKEKEKGENK